MLFFVYFQREKKRWAFKESQYFSVRACLGDEPLTAGESTRAIDPIILTARLQLLNGLRVASENDFDSTTGSVKGGGSGGGLVPPVVMGIELTSQVLRWLSGHQEPPESIHSAAASSTAVSYASTASTAAVFTIAAIDSRSAKRQPPPAFITSTLQQESSRKLGLSPSRTMALAQV